MIEHFLHSDNLISKSGKKLLPLPTIKLSPKGRNHKQVDLAWRNWTVLNALNEVQDDYSKTLIKAVDVNNWSTADGEMLNEMIFGEPNVKIQYN